MEPESNTKTDICIIGGGPGGSAIAKSLCDLGYQVVVVEKAAFPRPHVGICLSEQTNALLDYLGVGEKMQQAGFLQRKTTVGKWEDQEPILRDMPGCHVDRGVFDEILLENAKTVGAEVLQPAKVISATALPNGEWQLNLDVNGQSQSLNARFLVDASGRANALSGKRVKCGPPLFALHATWQLGAEPPYDGFMEAGKDAWLWMAELKDQKAMVSLYTDPKHFSKSKNKSLEAHYHEMLKQFSLLAYCQLEEVVDEIKGCDATSRYTEEPIGRNFIRIGDANLSVDPMSSQGVHLALAAGVQAAVVVNTLLRYPEHAEYAIEFYQQRQKERIQQFTERTSQEYARVAAYQSEEFWQARAQGVPAPPPPTEPEPVPQLLGTQRLQLSTAASIRAVAVLKNEFVGPEPALFHPELDRPVAFLGGENLVNLISQIETGQTAEALLNTWVPEVSGELGSQIIYWLWEHKILVPASS